MPFPTTLAPGEVLDAKYAVEGVIGEGGMGIVYRARDLEHDRVVAVKVLKRDAAGSDEALARFDREGRAASALTSRHVARVLDLGRTADGDPYIAMEHLVGSTLQALVAARGPLPAAEVVACALGIADALREAHALGIIHRDLKPANVFIVETRDGIGIPKVLDFGIAKVDGGVDGGSITTTGSVLGTPWYMAPEQLDTKRGVTTKTDVWSLGATMYNALTGKTPFEAESLYDLSVKVYAHEPTPITEHRPGLSPALVSLVHGCLQKNTRKRLALEEVALRLEELRRAAPAEEAPIPHAPERPSEPTVTIAASPRAPAPRIAAALDPTIDDVGAHHAPLPVAPPPPPRAPAPGRRALVASVVATSLVLAGAVTLAGRSRDPAPGAGIAAPPAPGPDPESAPAPEPTPVAPPLPLASGTGRSGAEPRPHPRPAAAPPRRRATSSSPPPPPAPAPKESGALTHER
jgi:serine/threonine-protein kinase